MNKIMLLAFAGAIGANAVAIAATPAGISLSKDKKITYANSGVQSYTPMLSRKTKLTSIYNNFATLDPKGVYMVGTGYSIGGPASVIGQFWFAAAFTPTANAIVMEVDVGAGYIEGAKSIVLVHVYADAAGIPGQELWSHKAVLPVFGSCCVVAAVADKAGFAVTSGKQYWVGITTLPNGTDTFAAWDFNVADQTDTGITAGNQGSGWVASTSLPNIAFGVYGK